MRSSGSMGCGCTKAGGWGGAAKAFGMGSGWSAAAARLTHCVRWLGAARRAHDIATDYALRRTAFGKPIGEHEGVGFMLADNEMDIHQCRLVIWHTAWVLDQGQRGRHESSMAKVICSEAIWRVV